MRESTIESALRKGVEALGGKCLKMVPTYNNGIPDRLVLLDGVATFVELKKAGEKPRKLQIHFAKELQAVGFRTVTLDSIEGVAAFLEEINDFIKANK